MIVTGENRNKEGGLCFVVFCQMATCKSDVKTGGGGGIGNRTRDNCALPKQGLLRVRSLVHSHLPPISKAPLVPLARPWWPLVPLARP